VHAGVLLRGRAVLMVGGGLSQRPAIRRLVALGAHVVAVDGDPSAPGLAEATVGVPVDMIDVEGVVGVARKHAVEGVLTVASDRAVPVVAAVAERLGLPGIGAATARVMTNKIAMRERLAQAGVPQPRFSAVHDSRELRSALERLRFPLVVKAADSGGQRGLFRVESVDELELRLPESIGVSRAQAAVVEEYHDGLELNGIAVVRDGETSVVTLSDRLRPPGAGFGVGWAHVYPASIGAGVWREAERVIAAAVDACGLRDGIAFPQLLVDPGDSSVRVVEIGARIGAGQMRELVLNAVGIDLVEVAALQALGEPVPDDLAVPRFHQPLAIRFLTAAPGVLPLGVLREVGGLDDVRAQPGVVEADVYLVVGETIRPVQLDVDRRGYVIAVGRDGAEALRRAERAGELLVVTTE
jgi:biotin carboxylase